MSPQDIAKDAIRIATTAGLSKDVIDLLKEKVALLTDKIATLQAENANLEKKIGDLEQELDRLRPKQDGLEEGAVRFLKLLFEGAELSVQEMAPRIGMSRGMAEYHCGILNEKQMIHPMSIGVVMDFGEEPTPTTWIITSKGRQYLVQNKLV